MAIKTLHTLSGLNKSIYLLLHTYRSKINFIASVSNSLPWSSTVKFSMKLPVLVEPLKQCMLEFLIPL